MKYKANKLVLFLDFILVLIFVGLDQLTKYLTVVNLKDAPAFVLIDGVIELRYLENRGAAFGMMQNCQWFFLIVGIAFSIAAAFLLWWIPTKKQYTILRIAIVMVASGAVGNIIDRAINNYVTDFIYFSYINFPIFNVADCFVTVGCTLLAILIIFFYKDDELDFKKQRVLKVHSSMIEKDKDNKDE